MQDNFFVADHKCVPGVVATLIPDDIVCMFSVNVNDFTLSFIAPLGTNNNYVCHVQFSPWLSSIKFISPGRAIIRFSIGIVQPSQLRTARYGSWSSPITSIQRIFIFFAYSSDWA